MTYSEDLPNPLASEEVTDKERFHKAIQDVFDRAKEQGISPVTGDVLQQSLFSPRSGMERLVVKPAMSGAFVPRELLVERPVDDHADTSVEPRVTYFANRQITIAADEQDRVLHTAHLDPLETWVPLPGSEFPVGQFQQTGPQLDHTLEMLTEGTIDTTSLWMRPSL